MNYSPSKNIFLLVLYATILFDLSIVRSVKRSEDPQISPRQRNHRKVLLNGSIPENSPSANWSISIEKQNEIPDLNELPPSERDNVCDNDGKQCGDEKASRRKDRSSRSFSLASRKEILKKQSRSRKYQRRLEKQNLLPAEKKEAIKKEINERSKRYREKNKQTIGFTSLHNGRIHQLKLLQRQGKATDEQMKEIRNHTENIRRIAKQWSAKKKAERKNQKR